MAKPIVKWAGGKSRLVGELLQRVPGVVRTYVEPFAGGAALFFALDDAMERGARSMESVVLADRNEDLMACYRAVRNHLDELIEALRPYRYDRDMYYEVRSQEPRGLSDVARAARLIYLNRTCFNGLWRVNSEGKFNVPFGRYKNPRILDEAGLRSASVALSKAVLHQGDFEAVTERLGSGDFVYFDPPYVPLSKTALFTSYVSGGFTPFDQQRLVGCLKRLREAGVHAMLSNADTKETRALYKGFAMHVVHAPRNINSDVSQRGHVRELLVTTWEKPGIYSVKASAKKPSARVPGAVSGSQGASVAKALRTRAHAASPVPAVGGV